MSELKFSKFERSTKTVHNYNFLLVIYHKLGIFAQRIIIYT